MAYLTDDELLKRFEYYTIQLEQRLLEEDFRSACDELPTMVVLSRQETVEITHVNKRHLELTGYSIEEVTERCPDYLKDTVHPSSLKNVQKFLREFYANQNSHQTMAFVQYARLYGDKNYSPLITFTKAPKKTNDLVIRLPLLLKEFDKMSPKMEQIVKMNEFKLKHFKQFQQLTEREIEILTLLANGCNNPQIAERLFISRNTVETHRKHIKRKLEIHSLRDLMRYAFAFDLIEY